MEPFNRPFQYILEGDTPVPVTDTRAWGEWFNDPHRRIVARTCLNANGDALPLGEDTLRNPPHTHVCISTVFLGIDHAYAWRDDDVTTPAILFETMIYLTHGARKGPGSKWRRTDRDSEFLEIQWRYTSASEARAMHARIAEQTQAFLRAGRSLAEVDYDEWPQADDEGENTQP